MFAWLGNRFKSDGKARELYGAIVARARDPVFYTRLQVEDTPEGRYEMISWHLVLVLERIGSQTQADEELRRELVEALVEDVDDAMREMGVGDTSVPGKVKRATAGLFARGVAFRAALSQADDAALQAAVVTYAYRGRDEGAKAELATAIRSTAASLARQPLDELRAGHVTFGPVMS